MSNEESSPEPTVPPAPDAPAPPHQLGPIVIRERRSSSAGADVYSGVSPTGQDTLAWHWPERRLPGEAVPRLAQLIENLQQEAIAGLAAVVHGSVAADDALIAFERPDGEELPARIARGTASPVEALSGALRIVEGLERADALGIPVGRWDPAMVLSLNERPAWILLAPCIHALPQPGPRPVMDSLREASACAPEVATGAVRLASATHGDRVASESYALGATLGYALTGEAPLDAADPTAYLQRQLVASPRPLADISPELERYRRLERLYADCVARSPEERPRDYPDLRDRLEGALREAERLDDDVAFLPARLADTMEIRRSRLREPSEEAEHRIPSRMVQLAALVMLVAILVFLLLRQTGRGTRGAPEQGLRLPELSAPATPGPDHAVAPKPGAGGS